MKVILGNAPYIYIYMHIHKYIHKYAPVNQRSVYLEDLRYLGDLGGQWSKVLKRCAGQSSGHEVEIQQNTVMTPRSVGEKYESQNTRAPQQSR